MGIIDYSSKLENYDMSKSIEEISREYYKENKEKLKFKIGDEVKITVAHNFNKQIFKIVDILLTYDISNPVSYKLDTDDYICLFKDCYLELA